MVVWWPGVLTARSSPSRQINVQEELDKQKPRHQTPRPPNSAMRLLVACPKCNRQYDASALAIGKRFRCHCGTVLSVQEPRGHDAAVVCCAYCGAPRADGAPTCAYCGADFT